MMKIMNESSSRGQYYDTLCSMVDKVSSSLFITYRQPRLHWQYSMYPLMYFSDIMRYNYIQIRCFRFKFQDPQIFSNAPIFGGGGGIWPHLKNFWIHLCNVHDNFWGNGLHFRDKKALKGKGKNHLGQCLMKVREEL